MAKKQHLDDFLREKLDQLPNAPVAGFEKVEGKMAVKSHRGILVLMLIPVLLSGLYWITTLNESDLYPNSHPSVHRSEERVSPLAIEVPEVVITPNTDLVQPLPFQEVVSNPSLANQSEMSRQSEPQVFAAHDGGGDDLLSNNQGVVSSAGIETPVNGNRNAPGQNAEPYTEPSRFTTEDAALVEPSIQNDKNPTNATAQDEGLVKEDKVEMTMFVASSNSMSSVDQEDLEEAFKDVDVREISPWSVTLNVYPNYTFRDFSIKSGYEDMVNDRYEAIINESEKGGFAFNVGLDVRYHIGNNVFLGSGLGYIQMKVNGNYDFLIFGEPIIDDHGAIEQFKAF